MKKFQVPIALLGMLSLACVLGCGESGVHQVQVTGTVSLDGKPLNGGSIKFIASDGTTPTGGGTVSNDGTYIAQVPPGSKKVLIASYKVIGKEPEYPGMPDSPMREKRMMVTPAIYNAAHRTPLTANIADAPQTGVNFELHSSAGQKKSNI